MEQPHEPEVKTHKSSRRQLIAVLLIFVGLISAVGIYVVYASTHARYRVQGIVAPGSNYGIEYSVSARYRKVNLSDGISEYDKGSRIAFIPGSPSKLIRMISDHLPSTMKHVGGNFFSNSTPGTIKQYCFQSSEEASITISSNGYPDCSGLSRSFDN